MRASYRHERFKDIRQLRLIYYLELQRRGSGSVASKEGKRVTGKCSNNKTERTSEFFPAFRIWPYSLWLFLVIVLFLGQTLHLPFRQ